MSVWPPASGQLEGLRAPPFGMLGRYRAGPARTLPSSTTRVQPFRCRQRGSAPVVPPVADHQPEVPSFDPPLAPPPQPSVEPARPLPPVPSPPVVPDASPAPVPGPLPSGPSLPVGGVVPAGQPPSSSNQSHDFGGLAGGPIPVSAMSKIPPPRRGRVALIVAGVLVFFGVIALGVHLSTRPWLARPEDDANKIERRFREVRDLAARTPRQRTKPGTKDTLVEAALHASTWESTAHGAEIPELDKKKLQKDLQSAVQAMVVWVRTPPTFTSAGCRSATGDVFPYPTASASSATAVPADAPAPVGSTAPADEAPQSISAESYYRLGRLSLEATPKRSRVPAGVRGVLRLAHLMRAQGNLEEYVVGLRLSRDAALWLKSRKQSPDRNFQVYRPSASELGIALARHAICSLAEVEGLEGWHFDVRTRFPGATHGPPFGIVSYERERLVIEDFYGSVIHDTHGTRRG